MPACGHAVIDLTESKVRFFSPAFHHYARLNLSLSLVLCYTDQMDRTRYPNFSFTVEVECKTGTAARTGMLQTPHGDVKVSDSRG